MVRILVLGYAFEKRLYEERYGKSNVLICAY